MAVRTRFFIIFHSVEQISSELKEQRQQKDRQLGSLNFSMCAQSYIRIIIFHLSFLHYVNFIFSMFYTSTILPSSTLSTYRLAMANSANCSLRAGESTKDFLSCARTAQKEKMQAIKPATKYLVYFIINLFSFLQAKTESHLYRIAIIPSQ